jgi:hypothetical protein
VASEDVDAMSNYNEEIVEKKEKKDKKRVLIRQKKQKSFFGIFKIIQ